MKKIVTVISAATLAVASASASAWGWGPWGDSGYGDGWGDGGVIGSFPSRLCCRLLDIHPRVEHTYHPSRNLFKRIWWLRTHMLRTI